MTDALEITLEDARARMQRAVDLARNGQHAAARAEALALTTAHADDLHLLHLGGVVMALGGAYDDALRLFMEALERFPTFHFTMMEVGNTFLAMRRAEDAVKWYLKAAKAAPTYGLAYRRAGEVMHAAGRHAEALQLLQQAHACDPGDPEVAASLANLCIFHNRRDKAAEVYETVLAAGRLRHIDRSRYLMLLTELGRFDKAVSFAAQVPDDIRTPYGYEAAVLTSHAALAAGLDRAALVARLKEREQPPRWLDAPALVAALRAAIAERRPLSFIRVGDGEARFLAYCDPRLRGRLTETQVEMFGDVPFRNWFGVPVATADQDEILRLQAATITAIEQADILGVTSAERLRTDNLHFGYLGHMESLLGSVLRTEAEMRLTDAMVHLELHRLTPFYGDILAGLDFVGVISPHPGLAKRLAERHGIGKFVEYLLPGESRLPKEQQNRQSVAHFPELYHQLCHGLEVPQKGGVFIVAGGLLGKIYCNVIRQRGGIAIDAGSIVDGWMGLNTRPGVYDRPQDWAL